VDEILVSWRDSRPLGFASSERSYSNYIYHSHCNIAGIFWDKNVFCTHTQNTLNYSWLLM